VTRYSKNQKDGEEIFYNPDGTVQEIKRYSRGKLTGSGDAGRAK
jgi:antitoxin component YwqK of YwqJK toxin-antitoxin module